jgi:hypothetical protein
MISGTQVRKGRVLLGWTPSDLARRAKVGVFTVNQIELIATPSTDTSLARIEAKLKAEGVIYRNDTTLAVLERRERERSIRFNHRK